MEENKYLSLKNWAEEDRPREKLLLKGKEALSNAELIAILIGSGTVEETAVDVGKKILTLSKNNLNELGRLSINDFKTIKGIGEAKAITIAAALELGRRRKLSEALQKPQITSSNSAFELFQPILADLPHEEFWALYLNKSNKLIEMYKVSQGGLAGTVIDVKIILKRGLELLANSIILCHNHPSGNKKPSAQDKEITHKIAEGGKLVDLPVLDHIIVANDKYFSFADNNLL